MSGIGNRAATGSTVQDLTGEEREALASTRVFFGHQSVGRNIMDGIRAVLADRSGLELELITSREPFALRGPAFIDADIGTNQDPASKAAAFLEVLSRGGMSGGGIAMFKLCYVDVTARTDVDALFAAYREWSRRVADEHPSVLQVHITVPLTVGGAGRKDRLQTLLGLPSETRANLARNRFNDLLRTGMGANVPIFDLAALESTRPDGTRVSRRIGRHEIFSLAPEWTDDGGHLNEAGRRYVADQFLVRLARIATARHGADAADGRDTHCVSATQN